MKILRHLYNRKIPVIGGVLASYLTFSIGVIVTAVLEATRHIISENFTDWNRLSLAFLSAGMAVSWLAILFVMKRVEELLSTNRITFQYFDRDSGLGRTALLNMARMLEPGSKVLTLNIFNRKFGGFEPGTEKVRRLYFGTLEKKLLAIDYRRILQVAPDADLRDVLDHAHLSHFGRVLELRDKGRLANTLQIWRVPIQYPYTFIIIKRPGGRSFLSLDILEETATTFDIVGTLQVNDPDEQLIAPFEALFRNLESQVIQAPLRAVDLGGVSPSSNSQRPA